MLLFEEVLVYDKNILNDLENIKVNIIEEKADLLYFGAILMEENKLLITDCSKGTMIIDF